MAKLILNVLITDEKLKELYQSKTKRQGDAGFDLYTSISKVGAFETVKASSGIKAVMVRESYYSYDHEIRSEPVSFDLRARSSIIKTPFMLHNGVGTIDSTYRGEILIPLRNVSPNESPSLTNISIAQITAPNLQGFDVVFVSELPFSQTVRGEGGFGSTN